MEDWNDPDDLRGLTSIVANLQLAIDARLRNVEKRLEEQERRLLKLRDRFDEGR
jgi:hypothetical protein